MSRKRIAMSQDAAILLPQEVLDEMGVHEWDEVDVHVADRTLIMRPLDVERAGKIENATNAVFERRSASYKNLID